MQNSRRVIRLMLQGLFLGTLGVASCACSHGGPKAKVVSEKKINRADDSFGLYTPSTVNESILRRGQKTRGTAALGSF